MVDLSQSPNWIVNIVLGAIAGALFTDYKNIVLYPLRRLKKTQYTGTWEEYHWTWKAGKKHLSHARLRITRGLLTPYSVDFWHVDLSPQASGDGHPTELRYKGTLEVEEGHVLIDLHATTHLETLSYRFHKWIPSSSDFVAGVWMSFDHTGAPAAGGALLTRNEVGSAEAARVLHERLDSLEGLLRVIDKGKDRRHEAN